MTTSTSSNDHRHTILAHAAGLPTDIAYGGCSCILVRELFFKTPALHALG